MTAWRSRIIGHDSVDPETLTGNPKNHRTHPPAQRQVVKDSTTMLAAEQLNRRCFGMEISPKYCAVILQRMMDAGCRCELEV